MHKVPIERLLLRQLWILPRFIKEAINERGKCHLCALVQGRNFLSLTASRRAYLNLQFASKAITGLNSQGTSGYDDPAPRLEVLRSFSPFYANRMLGVLDKINSFANSKKKKKNQLQYSARIILSKPFRKYIQSNTLNVLRQLQTYSKIE